MECDFVESDLMVVLSSTRGSVAYELSPKNVSRDGTPKIFTGIFGSNTQRGIIYKWCLLASSVSINFILPTSSVLLVRPYGVSRITDVGISGTVDNLH